MSKEILQFCEVRCKRENSLIGGRREFPYHASVDNEDALSQRALVVHDVRLGFGRLGQREALANDGVDVAAGSSRLN